MKRVARCGIALAAAALTTSTLAQQIVYPAKGQSAEQQKKDESQCHQWAVQNTGIDPAKQTAPPPPPTTATGTQRGAGVRGAARGAVVGEIVADDASTGAAVGAVAARGQSRRQNAAAQQQQQAAQQQTNATYLKARAACLEGRGYTVK
jgi:hypothetical protein